MGGQDKGRSEREEHGHQSCSGGDSAQRDVETDRTTSSSANLMDEKQEGFRLGFLVTVKDYWCLIMVNVYG